MQFIREKKQNNVKPASHIYFFLNNTCQQGNNTHAASNVITEQKIIFPYKMAISV